MYPPQRVTSSCRQSTTGHSRATSYRSAAYSPAATSQRTAAAHGGQAGEVVAGHGFLEPHHAELVQGGADAAGLPGGVAAVGVDHQLHVRARPGRGSVLTRAMSRSISVPQDCPILIFMAVQPAAAQPCDLVGELGVGQGGEPAGPVHRHRVPGPPEQRGQGHVEHPGLEVPQGDVDGADGLHDQAAGAEVPAGPVHRRPAAGDVHRRPGR